MRQPNTGAAQLAQSSVYQSSRRCRAAAPFGPLHTAPPRVPNPQPLVAGGMLTYPGDPRGNPPQHGALSSLSTSDAPFTVSGSHPAGPTFPNPSFAVPAAPSLNAAGEWGDPSLMEAPARFMAPGAAAAASLGYTGNAFTRYQLVRIDAEMSWHTYFSRFMRRIHPFIQLLGESTQWFDPLLKGDTNSSSIAYAHN
jgi:hypothetical protein